MKTTSIVIALGIFIVAAPASEAAEFNVNNPKMTWGETTNIMAGDVFVSGNIGKLNLIPVAIRAGIGVPNSNGVIVLSLHNKVTYPAYMAYQVVSTNPVVSKKVIRAFLPRRGEQFVLTMTDTNGVTVPKTQEGLDIGRRDSLKPNTRYSQARHDGYFFADLWPGIDDPHLSQLDLAKYFSLKNPGLYKLTFVQRLYFVDTNFCLKAVTLPPVTVDVRVEKNN